MTILDKIIETKKSEVLELKSKYSFNDFNNSKYFKTKSLSFINSLEKNKFNIISEIKKASPSKGVLIENFEPLEIAGQYMKFGTNAISILTDKQYFQGNIEYLNKIAEIKTVPLLRKDFIIDEHQILEAKANGADLILLICEALSKLQLESLHSAAVEIGLEVLIELHSAEQLKKLDFNKEFILGINNRDLRTFNVDIATTIELKKIIPKDQFVISESGINKKTDIDILRNNQINGILIGEHLMKSGNIQKSLTDLRNWCDAN